VLCEGENSHWIMFPAECRLVFVVQAFCAATGANSQLPSSRAPPGECCSTIGIYVRPQLGEAIGGILVLKKGSVRSMHG
jgi:hypothetical protein